MKRRALKIFAPRTLESPWPVKEAAANARLIAAAPALLNSVIEALQQFGFESWDDSRMACIARMRKTLRLAIAASDEDLENNGCLR
jgi:hypothetical protein